VVSRLRASHNLDSRSAVPIPSAAIRPERVHRDFVPAPIQAGRQGMHDRIHASVLQGRDAQDNWQWFAARH